MPQEEKDYFGKLYGIRLRSKKDKQISTKVKEIAESRDMDLGVMILGCIERSLNLHEGVNNISFNDLNTSFISFFENTRKKSIQLEKKLLRENYKKKESLENFIHEKYPNKIQREKFFLELITTQIDCELQLLEDFFFFGDYQTQFFVGYAGYLYNERDCEKKDLVRKYMDYKKKLLREWYDELKIAGVISNLEDLKLVGFKDKKNNYEGYFNFSNLEKLIYDLYEGEKLRHSPREKTILNIKSALSTKKPKEYSKKQGLEKNLKKYFKELIRYSLNLPNLLLNADQDRYMLFKKIGYEPKKFNKIGLEFERYIDFIEKNNLQKILGNSLDEKFNLYKFLNDYFSFPPADILLNLRSFIDFYDFFNSFFMDLQKKIENHAYNRDEIIKIVEHHIKLTRNPFPVSDLLDDIPFDKLKIYFENPEKDKKIEELLKYYLKNECEVDFDQLNENLTNQTFMRIFEKRRECWDTLPKDLVEKYNEKQLDLLKSFKKIYNEKK